MPELTPIAGVTLTGERPLFGDPFAADSAGMLDYLGGLSLNEYAAARESAYPGAPNDAFLAPLPELLPEVIVEPPPRVVPVPVPGVGIVTAVARGLTGLAALLFSTPTASPQLDEAPTPPGIPPPPPIEPTLAEPDLPPNWWDMGQGGDSGLLEPIRTPGLPVPLPDWRDDPFWKPVELEPVTVTPPGRTTRSIPSFPGLFADPFSTVPSGTPYDFPIPFDFTTDPGPGSAPTPIGTPGIDPIPGDPFLDPFPIPDIRVAPDPLGAPAPDVFSPSLPDGFIDPIGDPIAAPSLPDRPGTVPGTPTKPATPINFADPIGDALADPFLTEFQPEPLRPRADTCQCDKPKKEKKKRKPREKCFKGTYIQRRSGTIFRPTEEVDCAAALPREKRVSKRETDPFGRPVPKRRKSRRTPTWQDTINDVFYPKP